MLKIGEFFMIRELHQKGWTKTAIAEETGFNRKTVSKYINNNQVPRTSKRKDKESKLESFKPYVLKRAQEGTTNCMVLFEEIQAMGYEGKTTILREFVKPYRVQLRRLQMIQLRSWRKIKKLHKELRKRKWKGELPRLRMNRWRSSHSPPVDLPNNRFREIKLVFLLDIYNELHPQRG